MNENERKYDDFGQHIYNENWGEIDKFIKEYGVNTPFYSIGLFHDKKSNSFYYLHYDGAGASTALYETFYNEKPFLLFDNQRFIKWTILHFCSARYFGIWVINKLLQRGASPLIEDSRGCNCLQILKENEDYF